ncbi:MAG: PIN domain-containing protein [Spirochaetales bacterium]|nr:PIN domain-containing protein [Spirochaetales bacterium]
MKKVLIDLNIIIDMLNKRDDHEAAAALFDKCVRRQIKGYISSHEITTLSYFLQRQKHDLQSRNRIITVLLDNLSILSPNERHLRNAMNSQLSDYEDAVIDELATSHQVDYIITRNQKDFHKSQNKILTAREFLGGE